MRLLSELRPDGDPNIPKSIGKEALQVPEGWILLQGDENDRSSSEVRRTPQAALAGGSLFGPCEPPKKSLRELVLERANDWRKLIIEEDIAKRVAWSNAIERCQTATSSQMQSVSGEYRFIYRNYVNHEEMTAMLCRRWTMASLLLRLGGAGLLQIDEDKSCILLESCKVFGFLPMAIEWQGKLVGSEIEWTSTSCQLGWKRLGKVFDKPAAAEKLRQENWKICLDADDNDAGVCVTYRKGIGSLVYARPSIFNEN